MNSSAIHTDVIILRRVLAIYLINGRLTTMWTYIPICIRVVCVFNVVQCSGNYMILLFQITMVHTTTMLPSSKCLSSGLRYWAKIARINFTINEMHLDEIIHRTVKYGRL